MGSEPPEELDGARVLYWCHLPPEEGEALGAAICQYEGHKSFYLFWCNERWEVIGDTDHPTVDDATDALWQLYQTRTGVFNEDRYNNSAKGSCP